MVSESLPAFVVKASARVSWPHAHTRARARAHTHKQVQDLRGAAAGKPTLAAAAAEALTADRVAHSGPAARLQDALQVPGQSVVDPWSNRGQTAVVLWWLTLAPLLGSKILPCVVNL